MSAYISTPTTNIGIRSACSTPNQSDWTLFYSNPSHLQVFFSNIYHIHIRPGLVGLIIIVKRLLGLTSVGIYSIYMERMGYI